MPYLRLQRTYRWGSRSPGMCHIFGSPHLYTPHARPDAVTVQLDPAMALGLNLDDFLGVCDTRLHALWSYVTTSYFTRTGRRYWKSKVESPLQLLTALTYTIEEDGSDEEYGKPRKKSKFQDKRPPPHSEMGRATRHTLDENLDQMMSGSFDVSFLSDAQGEQEFFSSPIDAGFGFGDSEDFGLGDIGDELAKELGEGWTSAPVQPKLVLSSRRRRNVHVVLAGLLRRRNNSFLIRSTRT